MKSHAPALLLLLAAGVAAGEADAPPDPEAVPLDPVMARPPEDAFTHADRQLRKLMDSLPGGEPRKRKPGALESAASWALLPSDPVPLDNAAKLSAEEHLRNSGRSREQLP